MIKLACNRRVFLQFSGASTLAVPLQAVFPVHAADVLPDKIFKIMVPFAPGGQPDIHMRALAPLLAARIGRTVIVENKLGAAGQLGLQAFRLEPADGSGLFYNAPSLVSSLALAGKTALLDDLLNLTLTSDSPSVMVVSADSPYKTVGQLVAAAQAQPGKLTYGSSGIGSPAHIGVELFKQTTRTDIRHIPYKSAPEMLPALVNGDITMAMAIVGSFLPLIQSGRLRALGTTFSARIPSLPAVPTMHEAGVSGFALSQWGGLAVRKGTPKPAVDLLFTALQQCLAAREVQDAIVNGGAVVRTSRSPEECEAFAASQIRQAVQLAATLGPESKS